MKIQDYIHFYLGVTVIVNGKKWTLYGIVGKTAKLIKPSFGNRMKEHKDISISQVKPVLKDISNITEAEQAEFKEDQYLGGPDGEMISQAEQIRFLTGKGYDVFGLIKAGLATEERKSHLKK